MSFPPAVDSVLTNNVAAATVNAISLAVSSGQIASKEALRNAVYDTFLNYFSRLTRPEFVAVKYHDNDFKNPDVVNLNIANAEEVFNSISQEYISLIELLLSQEVLLINTSTDVVANLESVTAKLDAIENQIERRQFETKSKSVITLFDDFSTMAKLDFSVNNPAKIIPGFGAELPNKSDQNWASKVVDFKVTTQTGSVQSAKSDPVAPDHLPYKPRPYEGKRFDYPESARPEGGTWRIGVANSKIDIATPTLERGAIYTNMLSTPAWPTNTPILIKGTAATGASTTTSKTVYDITKVTSGVGSTVIATGSETVTRATGETAATGFKITAYQAADGTSVTVDSSSSPYYTAAPRTVQVTEPAPEREGDYIVDPSLSSKSIISEAERYDDRAPENVKDIDTGADKFANTITRTDFTYYETEPTEDQKLLSRLKVFDGNLDTFWEIEYTPFISSIDQAVFATTDYAGASIKATTDARSNVDSLTVTLEVKFDYAYTMNYITLDPFFFGDIRESSFIVEDIAIKSKESAEYETIPGFSSDFNNTLNFTANSQITIQQASRIDATSSSQFLGKGFWSLPAGTTVQYIRLRLKQSQAIANPFPLHNVQLLRKLSKSISESRSSSQGSQTATKKTDTSSSGSGQILENGRMTQWIEFGYLETILNKLSSGSSSSMLAGSTSGGNQATQSSSQKGLDTTHGTGGLFQAVGTAMGTSVMMKAPTAGYSAPGTIAAGVGIMAAGFLLDRVLSGGSSSNSSVSNSSNFQDTGYQVNKEWDRIIWSRVRYPIGIRELGFHAKTFDVVGEVESIPYEIYTKGKQVTLKVTRTIPALLTAKYPTTNWIEYYIMINDTKYPIQPVVGEAAQFDGGIIPSSYQLDKIVTSGDKAQIRFYATISRPTDTGVIPNVETMTPILHGYELIIEDV